MAHSDDPQADPRATAAAGPQEEDLEAGTTPAAQVDNSSSEQEDEEHETAPIRPAGPAVPPTAADVARRASVKKRVAGVAAVLLVAAVVAVVQMGRNASLGTDAAAGETTALGGPDNVFGRSQAPLSSLPRDPPSSAEIAFRKRMADALENNPESLTQFLTQFVASPSGGDQIDAVEFPSVVQSWLHVFWLFEGPTAMTGLPPTIDAPLRNLSARIHIPLNVTVTRLFQLVDMNHDGTITAADVEQFSQWLAPTLQRSGPLPFTFKLIDLDDSKSIDRRELRIVLGELLMAYMSTLQQLMDVAVLMLQDHADDVLGAFGMTPDFVISEGMLLKNISPRDMEQVDLMYDSLLAGADSLDGIPPTLFDINAIKKTFLSLAGSTGSMLVAQAVAAVDAVDPVAQQQSWGTMVAKIAESDFMLMALNQLYNVPDPRFIPLELPMKQYHQIVQDKLPEVVSYLHELLTGTVLTDKEGISAGALELLFNLTEPLVPGTPDHRLTRFLHVLVQLVDENHDQIVTATEIKTKGLLLLRTLTSSVHLFGDIVDASVDEFLEWWCSYLIRPTMSSGRAASGELTLHDVYVVMQNVQNRMHDIIISHMQDAA